MGSQLQKRVLLKLAGSAVVVFDWPTQSICVGAHYILYFELELTLSKIRPSYISKICIHIYAHKQHRFQVATGNVLTG